MAEQKLLYLLPVDVQLTLLLLCLPRHGLNHGTIHFPNKPFLYLLLV